jgi:peptidyl-prolyl cis-trans isomerase A (cyclophilin A)
MLKRVLLAFLSCAAAVVAAGSALLDPQDPFWREPAPAVYRTKIKTSKGAFLIEVHRDWAPHGADRYYNLVRAGFFDDSRFFRVRSSYIAQFGIPGDPEIAMRWMYETIPPDPRRQSNVRGTVAFAMVKPDARTTQLYINLADNRKLDADGFAPIGRVVQGMEVVNALYGGYGEKSGGGMRAGKQQKLFAEGNRYLDREFPKLDRLLRAIIVGPESR